MMENTKKKAHAERVEKKKEELLKKLYVSPDADYQINVLMRLHWLNRYNEDCPADKVPDRKTFAEELKAACIRQPSCFTHEAVRQWEKRTFAIIDQKLPPDDMEPGLIGWEAWLWYQAQGKSNERVLHPLAPLVEAFIDSEGKDIVRKPYGILPKQTYGAAVHAETWGREIGESLTGNTSEKLITFDGEGGGTVQKPPLIFMQYDHTGQIIESPGKGAPLAGRMHTEFLMDGAHFGSGRYYIKLRDIRNANYLPENFRMGRDYPAVKEAFHRVHNMFIAGKGGSLYSVVNITKLPGPDLDDVAVIYLEYPTAQLNGAKIHRETLRRYGRESNPKYRLYGAVCVYWDTYGTHSGRIIRATRPIVARNPEGYLVDVKGRVLTQRNGSPITSSNDKRAVRTGGMERNSAADRYPALSKDDIAAFAYGAPMKGTSHSTIRNRRRDAFKALMDIQADGNCIVEETTVEVKRPGSLYPVEVNKWRVFPPKQFWTEGTGTGSNVRGT